MRVGLVWLSRVDVVVFGEEWHKPWEMEGPPQAVGCGLLAKLGLTTVTQVKLVPVPKSGP